MTIPSEAFGALFLAADVDVTRRYEFSASHSVSAFGEGHKCARLHGHTYTVHCTVKLPSAALCVKNGLSVPFSVLDDAVRPVVLMLDHSHLNTVLAPMEPTAEAVSALFVEQIRDAFPWSAYGGRGIIEVRVDETPKGSVTLRLSVG